MYYWQYSSPIKELIHGLTVEWEGLELRERCNFEKIVNGICDCSKELLYLGHLVAQSILYHLYHPISEKNLNSSEEVRKLLEQCFGEMSKTKPMYQIAIKISVSLLKNYLDNCLREGLLKMTKPDQPKRVRQNYCLGKKVLEVYLA